MFRLQFKPRRHLFAATATLVLVGAAVAAGLTPAAQSDSAAIAPRDAI